MFLSYKSSCKTNFGYNFKSELLFERDLNQRIDPKTERNIIHYDYDPNLLSQYLSNDLFSEPKLLIIKDLHLAGKDFKNELIRLLPQVQSDLVITYQNTKDVMDVLNEFKKYDALDINDEKASDKKYRGQNLPTLGFPIYDNQLPIFIQKEFRNKNLEPEAEIIEYLTLNVPENLDLLISMIEQLSWDLEQKKITYLDVSPYLESLGNENLFMLNDAILSKNYLLIAKLLNSKLESIEPMPFLALLHTTLLNLVSAQAVQNREIELSQAKLNPWMYQNKLLPLLRGWNENSLRLALKKISQVYQQFLTGDTNSNYLIEKLALTI